MAFLGGCITGILDIIGDANNYTNDESVKKEAERLYAKLSTCEVDDPTVVWLKQRYPEKEIKFPCKKPRVINHMVQDVFYVVLPDGIHRITLNRIINGSILPVFCFIDGTPVFSKNGELYSGMALHDPEGLYNPSYDYDRITGASYFHFNIGEFNFTVTGDNNANAIHQMCCQYTKYKPMKHYELFINNLSVKGKSGFSRRMQIPVMLICCLFCPFWIFWTLCQYCFAICSYCCFSNSKLTSRYLVVPHNEEYRRFTCKKLSNLNGKQKSENTPLLN